MLYEIITPISYKIWKTVLSVVSLVIYLETSIEQSSSEEQFVVTYLKGFSSRPIAVPTIYAIRFFCSELESALTTFAQSSELQELLASRDEEKNEIQQQIQRIQKLFNDFQMADLRR